MEHTIKFNLLSKDSILPTFATSGSAGLDISSPKDIKIPSKSRHLIQSGLSVNIPIGYYGQIASRSGLAYRHSLDVVAGVIDSDYRGEIGILLANNSDIDYYIKKGDRIAQLIIIKIAYPLTVIKANIENELTDRSTNGFGSTGY
jgi:dUTP pyrophosphatase